MELNFNCKDFFLSFNKKIIYIFHKCPIHKIILFNFCVFPSFSLFYAIFPITNLWISYNNFQSLHVILLNSFDFHFGKRKYNFIFLFLNESISYCFDSETDKQEFHFEGRIGGYDHLIMSNGRPLCYHPTINLLQ